MKKLLLFLFAIGVAMGAKGEIVFSLDGKTVTFTNATEQQCADNEARFGSVEKAIFVGTFDTNGWNNKVKGKLTSCKILDFSDLDKDVFPNLTSSNSLSQCSNVTTLYLPDDLEIIPDQMCQRMSKLEEVHIPNTVTTIGKQAFENCNALKHVALPEGVEILGEEAFKHCSNLGSVSIPTTLREIKDGCFKECVKMYQLTIPDTKVQPVFGKKIFENAGIRDIYLMTTDINKVPQIYPAQNIGDADNGTFGNQQLYANGTAPSFSASDLPSNYTSEEMMDKYMYLNRTNYNSKGMAILHFPSEMRSFYDANIYRSTDYKAADPQEDDDYEFLSDTYLFKDKDGNTWPAKEQQSGAATIRHTGRWSNPDNLSSDKFDYARRVNAGLPSTYDKTEPLAEAWRQFIIMQGDVDNSGETFEKKLDDTWYTMCFPFDLSDEQLEELFNANYNICEFTAANIVKVKVDESEEQEDALVLYFTEIAKSTYIDEDEEKVYESIDTESGEYDSVNRRYKDSEGNVYSYKGTNTTTMQQWGKIRGVLAFAGHPYMVHPNVGVIAGRTKEELGGVGNTVMESVPRYLTGIKKRFTGTGYDPYENPEEAAGYREIGSSDNEKYYLKIFTQKRVELKDCRDYSGDEVNHASGLEGTKLGYMTFLGNTDAPSTNGTNKKIPQNSYFLASVYDKRNNGQDSRKSETFAYPRYYRQSEENPTYGNWTQYTAIVKPDSDAASWLQSNIWNKHTSLNSTAKSANVIFDNVDEITNVVTNINEVLQEAQQQKQPVEYYKVIYNINGQVVKTGTTDTRNLPTGVYIISGKKYFVK